MRKKGGREGSCSPASHDNPPQAAQRGFSPSKLDTIDLRILTLAEDRPMTALAVAEKADIPFVQCLRRTRRLLEMGLLERLENTSDEVGLYRYRSSKKHL